MMALTVRPSLDTSTGSFAKGIAPSSYFANTYAFATGVFPSSNCTFAILVFSLNTKDEITGKSFLPTKFPEYFGLKCGYSASFSFNKDSPFWDNSVNTNLNAGCTAIFCASSQSTRLPLWSY